MKKLLHISASPRPLCDSASRMAAEVFLQRLLEEGLKFDIFHLDLWTQEIPHPTQAMLDGTMDFSQEDDDGALLLEREETKKILFLCDQFISADFYLISAPMWNGSFPAILKRYLDAVLLPGKVYEIKGGKMEGLLKNKQRYAVYIQASGLVHSRSTKQQPGAVYLQNLSQLIGIDEFDKILVQGTQEAKIGVDKALEKAKKDMDNIVKNILLSF